MFGNLTTRMRGFAVSTRGNVLLELGLAAPLLAAVLLGLLDLGSMAFDSMALQNAARAGAQYAMKNPTDTAGIQDAVNNSTTLDPLKLTVDSSTFCECSNGSSVLCGGVCADSKPVRAFVSVAVHQTYSPILPLPGLDHNVTLGGQSIFRIQ